MSLAIAERANARLRCAQLLAICNFPDQHVAWTDRNRSGAPGRTVFECAGARAVRRSRCGRAEKEMVVAEANAV
jgi:hypothetical protein